MQLFLLILIPLKLIVMLFESIVALRGHFRMFCLRNLLWMAGSHVIVIVFVLISGMLRGGTPPSGLSEELHRVTGGLPAAVAAGVRELHRREVLCFDGIGELGELSGRMLLVIIFQCRNLLESSLTSLRAQRREESPGRKQSGV